MFTGDLHDFEWRRFRFYAGRVRAITNAGRLNISPSVFRELLRVNGDRPWIPTLEEFRGNIPLVHATPNHYDIDDTELLSVVSPSLRRLDIRLHDTTGRLQPPFPVDDVPQILLEKLGPRLPRLEKVRILCQGIGPHLPTSRVLSFASMSAFTGLTTVDVLRCRSSCTPDLLHHLASLHTLVNLSADIGANDGSAADAVHGFRSLRRLHVKGRVDRLLELIATVESPHVHAIRVQQVQDDVGPDFEEAWCGMIDMIASRFDGSLREVNFATAFQFGESMQYGHSEMRLLRVVRSLLALRDLESVMFSWHIERTRIDMRDEDVLELASAWRKLKTLELHFENSWQLPVETLIHWAQLCPNLTRLILPNLMDREHSTIESFPATSHALRYIHFGHAPRPERTARILDRLFPNLDTTHNQPDGRLLGWTQVLQFLAQFQQERRAAGSS
ncbi:hypothetical protein EVJ58_g8954 [Rhodofomes roseus]|uniref:F-box domain-containing protein n=1 Tax=Rhodofomes roseus TaxID=34475 RepID=A0A4Y9XWY0_9APHY|nr:hypothetical protein EVJ58_g8954 [Rhodofomes roseus]